MSGLHIWTALAHPTHTTTAGAGCIPFQLLSTPWGHEGGQTEGRGSPTGQPERGKIRIGLLDGHWITDGDY